MLSTTRVRVAYAVLLAGGSIGLFAALTSATASAGAAHAASAHTAKAAGPGVKRFDLNGYVIVMNFKTGVVYDYAPGSTHPESSGTVTVQKRGSQPLP